MTTLCVTHLISCTPIKPVVSLIKHADAWVDSFSAMSSLHSVSKNIQKWHKAHYSPRIICS